MRFCKMMRLGAVQRWPVGPKAPQRAPSIARSRFASSRTIIGFFPPSSSEQCLKLWAAMPPMILPTADDPVSETARTSGCSASGVHFGAKSCHDVDDTLREAGVGEGANQVDRGKGCVLRGLDDTGVAAADGRDE